MDRRGHIEPGRRALHLGNSIIAISVIFSAVLIPTTAAFATTKASTATTTTTSGSLSIGTITPKTIDVPIGGTGYGLLPTAAWSDTTGTGAGWSGTVAVSDFTYTGPWLQTAGSTTGLWAANSPATTSAFTGTSDGVEYTIISGP